MAKASIDVKLFNGRREPFSGSRVLVTVQGLIGGQLFRDYLPRNSSGSGASGNIQVPYKAAGEKLSVIAWTDDHRQVGVGPMNPSAQPQLIEMMLVGTRAVPEFLNWADLDAQHGDFKRIFRRSLPDAEGKYDEAKKTVKELACVMNLITAMKALQLPGPTRRPTSALSFIQGIDWTRSIQNDRCYFWARPDFKTWLASGGGALKSGVPREADHPGASVCYKEQRFAEGNLQVCVLRTSNPANKEEVLVEVDIDYYHNGLDHFLFEYVPNWLSKQKTWLLAKVLPNRTRRMTDPLVVYVIRWTSGRMLAEDFAPPYTLG